MKLLKSILLLPLIFGLGQSYAAPIASDSFANTAGGADYNVASLRNQTATVGTSGYVAGNSWIRGTGAIYCASGGLTHPLTTGTELDGVVVAFSGTGTAGRAQVRQLDYTPVTDTYYFSALFRKNSETQDLVAGVTGAIGGSNGAYTIGSDLMIGLYDGNFSVVVPGTGITTLIASASLATNETYFALMEIDYSTTGDDSVTVTVYDDSSAQVATQTYTGLNLDGKLGYFAAATNNYGPSVETDEFRYGTELSDVMGAAAPDTTAPSWTASYPQADTPTPDGFTVRAAINEAGTAYYVVVADGATTPDAAQVKAGVDYGGVTVVAGGSITLSAADTENTAGITGLSASTAYDVYFVAEDDEGSPNLQGSPSTAIDITTTAPDTTDPTLAPGDIVDDKSGGPVIQNSVVTYTVTFSEDMDESTVTTADFGNAGSATVTINSVTETSPGVFAVEVTPTTTGTLQLRVNASAILTDLAGNDLDTGSAILDADILTVEEGDPNLVAYYPFDSDLTDDSGNGNHGTQVDAGTTGNSGITTAAGASVFGGGAYFNAEQGDFIDIPDQVFANGDSWSVSMWSRKANNDATGMLIGDRGDTNNFLWQTSNFSGLRMRNSSGNTADKTAPKDTAWHHWVFVADGAAGEVTVYLDNAVLVPAFAFATGFEFREIADAYSSLNYAFIGEIDEVYIYNTAIDAAKVGELFAGGDDTIPPTFTSIVDNRAGGPVESGSLVTYTVTFSEDMDDATVDASDFSNAGTIVSYTIGTVTETSPGVFSVPVTPNADGTLRLQINQSAVLSDTAGNDLDTSSAILDDTTITVETDNINPTLATGDIQDDQSGGPVAQGTTVTYTVTFSEDINDSTVDATDFGNEGNATFTIGNITEVSPGVFEVQITPDTTGTLQLKVLSGAVITDAAGNPLDTTGDIIADTVITVLAGFDPNAVQTLKVVFVAGQSNADGRAPTSGLPTSPVNLQLPQDDVDFFHRVEGTIFPLTTLRPGLSETGGFGPEVTLGRYLADEIANGLTTRVAVIKYANGGTNLVTQWAGGGDGTTSGDGTQYVRFQETVTAGLAALGAEYPNADIDLLGTVWVQGESDSGTTYETDLTNFIADLRLTYQADLPFVVVRVGNTAVRDAQTAVAAADPLTGLIDTDGFSKQDSLHFDASGQQDIGDASAIEILDLNSPISVSAISGDTTEAGGTATFTVVLNNQPTDDVIIGISSDNTDEGTVSPSSLTFTNGNWDSAQTVTVTGVDDALDDGDITYNIVTAAATSADADFNGVDPADVSVTNIDDDSPPTAQPIAYYSFDSDFSDGSGNGNHLSIANGTPNITTTGSEVASGGGALSLDHTGNEWLSMATELNFSLTDAWSVSFWAKQSSASLSNNSTGMVMGDSGTTASFIWNTSNSSQVAGGNGTGGLRFRPASGGVGAGNNDYAVGTDTSYNHFVLVADGSGNITVYHNNTNLGTTTASGGTIFDINAIGRAYSSNGFTFGGQLDEIYIYDTAIDAAKVSELFNVSNETVFDTWIGDYDFSGFTNPDLTSTGNPDGDPYTNLQEHAFGFDPTSTDTGTLTIDGSENIIQNGPPQLHVDNGRYYLRYTRRADYATAGLNYTAQFTHAIDAGGSFEDVPGGSVIGTGTGAAGEAIEAISIEYPWSLPSSGRKARFGRLEVEQAP